MGIDQSTYDTFTRPENHKTVAVPCSTCGASFSSEEYYDAHVPKCGKKKTSPAETAKKPMTVRCEDESCDKMFASIDAMRKHSKRVHLGEVFVCNYVECNKSFTQKAHMDRHVKAVHLGERAFKCQTCGLSFQYLHHLNGHNDAVHLGKRPFICEEVDCGATFTRAFHLRSHIRSKHSEVPRLPCTHPGCPATFKRAANLRFHLMDHTGERPFACPYERCGDRFKSQRDVNTHIKKAKKHEGHRKASKIIDKYLLPFTCQVQTCIDYYSRHLQC